MRMVSRALFALLTASACGGAPKAAPTRGPIPVVKRLDAPIADVVAVVLDDRIASDDIGELVAALVTRPRAEIDAELRRRAMPGVGLTEALIHRIDTATDDDARAWLANSLSVWDPARGDAVLARETR